MRQDFLGAGVAFDDLKRYLFYTSCRQVFPPTGPGLAENRISCTLDVRESLRSFRMNSLSDISVSVGSNNTRSGSLLQAAIKASLPVDASRILNCFTLK